MQITFLKRSLDVIKSGFLAGIALTLLLSAAQLHAAVGDKFTKGVLEYIVLTEDPVSKTERYWSNGIRLCLWRVHSLSLRK